MSWVERYDSEMSPGRPTPPIMRLLAGVLAVTLALAPAAAVPQTAGGGPAADAGVLSSPAVTTRELPRTLPGGFSREGLDDRRAPGDHTSSVIQSLPRLGDAGGEEFSLSTERRIGDAIIRDLRREQAIWDDVEITEYLNRFGAQLADTASANGYSFEFFLVRDDSLNAFALPGGVIGVHSGLIVAAQSESELASVLAHEIGHVTQRHIARMLAQQKQGSILQIAALVLGALAARSNPQAAMGAMTMGMSASQQMLLSFSRDAEREADRVGLETLRDAGFDPSAMVSFFERLQQATRVYDSNAPAYLRTHPLTVERIADMRSRQREGRYRQRADSIDFTLARAKLRAVTDTGVDNLRTVRTTFERQLRDKTTADERAAWFGVASVAFAQRDWAASERALAEVRRRLREGHPFVERLAADLKLAQGDAAGAYAVAQAGAQRWPQARALVHLQAQALLAQKDWPRAVDFLQKQLSVWRADPSLWRLLAQAQAGRGDTALAHRATAEEYALMGGWLAAIEQLKLAQRSGSLDFYTGSQVDARIAELQGIYTRERQERAGR